MIAPRAGIAGAHPRSGARSGSCLAVSKRWWPSASTMPLTSRRASSAMRGTRSGFADPPEGVVEALFRRWRWRAWVRRRRHVDRVVEEGATSPVASERPQIGSRLARVAQQFEAVALGSRAGCARGASRRPRLAVEFPKRADDAGGAPRQPVVAGEVPSGTPRTSRWSSVTSAPAARQLRERGGGAVVAVGEDRAAPAL